MDVAKVNAIEGELDSFVARRDKERRRDGGARPAEERWAESVRRHHAQRQQELAREWLRWHQRMLSNHARTASLIAAHHRSEIERYEQMLGLDGPEPNGKDAA